MAYSQLGTGDFLTVDADLKRSANHQNTLRVRKIISIKSNKVLRQNSTKKQLSEPLKAVVLMLDFNDYQASNKMPINGIHKRLYVGDKSVRQNYVSSSYHQVDWSPDGNGDGLYDIFPVKLNYNVDGTCTAWQWAKDARQAAAEQGIDLSPYKYRIYLLPTNTTCFWQGLGVLSCTENCDTWIKPARSRSTYAHELGHNLGLHHASTDLNNTGKVESEYGDQSSFMGNESYHQVNGPHRYSLGWFEHHPESVRSINKSAKVSIANLELPTSEQKTQLLIINKAELDKPYYLSFRQAGSSFGMRDEYANKLSIHRTESDGRRSVLLAALDNGETFVDAYSGVKITATQQDEQSMQADIRYLARCVVKETPCNLSYHPTVTQLNKGSMKI